jgi:transposase InsO family protein
VRQNYRWLARYRSGGAAALADRNSAPQRCKHRIGAEWVGEIERLRRQRMSGPAMARQLHMPVSTVGAVLRRLGLGKLATLEPKPVVVRYERERPGELIHLDSKKLGRIEGIGHRITGRTQGAVNRHHGIGWEALHVCIDDATRLAYSEILADERKASAVGFLERAFGWFAGHGVTVERVMTDNGSAYLSKAFRTAVAAAGFKHKRTRPYTPRTNGKAERFIQTSLREWAYARPYASSQERSMALIPGSTITISSDHTPPWPTIRPSSASANRSCLVRPKGPLLRPDLPPITTGAASRGKDRRRRPAIGGAQRPCSRMSLRSRSLKEGLMPDKMNNPLANDT